MGTGALIPARDLGARSSASILFLLGLAGSLLVCSFGSVSAIAESRANEAHSCSPLNFGYAGGYVNIRIVNGSCREAHRVLSAEPSPPRGWHVYSGPAAPGHGVGVLHVWRGRTKITCDPTD